MIEITHLITQNVQIYAELEQHLGANVSRCKELQADILSSDLTWKCYFKDGDLTWK